METLNRRYKLDLSIKNWLWFNIVRTLQNGINDNLKAAIGVLGWPTVLKKEVRPICKSHYNPI